MLGLSGTEQANAESAAMSSDPVRDELSGSWKTSGKLETAGDAYPIRRAMGRCLGRRDHRLHYACFGIPLDGDRLTGPGQGTGHVLKTKKAEA